MAKEKLLPCDEKAYNNKLKYYCFIGLFISVVMLVGAGILCPVFFSMAVASCLAATCFYFAIVSGMEIWQQNHCTMVLDSKVVGSHRREVYDSQRRTYDYYYFLIVQYDVPINNKVLFDSDNNNNNDDKNDKNNQNVVEYVRIQKIFSVNESTYHNQPSIMKVFLRFDDDDNNNNKKRENKRIEPIYASLSSSSSSFCGLFLFQCSFGIVFSIIYLGMAFLFSTNLPRLIAFQIMSTLHFVFGVIILPFLLAHATIFYNGRSFISMQRIPAKKSLSATIIPAESYTTSTTTSTLIQNHMQEQEPQQLIIEVQDDHECEIGSVTKKSTNTVDTKMEGISSISSHESKKDNKMRHIKIIISK